LGHLGGFADELPAGGNPDNPYVWWPSQYSEQAFLDAEQTVRDFLLELKQKPYAHIIAGIFICGGHDGQFMISYRDYSAPSLEQWRQFLRERYGSDAALAKSWNRPGATIDAAEILPDNPENASDEMFYSPTEHQAYADFKEFEDRQIWKNPERFARLFKEIFGSDKLAMTWSMGGGWRKNFDYFFASKHLDAFVAQPSYEYRLPGSSGGFNMVAESYSRHGKLAISELDTRNWMRGVYNELMTMRIGTPGSADHFQTLVMKEAGRMVSRYHGYWFYDIGGNAYRHPAVAEVIRTTRAAADWVFQQAGNDDFVPDVAVVFHQPTIYWEAPWVVGKGNLASYLIDYQLYAMRLSGVPFSCYYLSDVMANPEFQKHKVYIFLNAFYLRESERAFIRDKLQGGGRTLVWNYAAGFLQEGGQSAARVSALTGMTVHLDDAPATQLTVPVPGDVLSRNLPPNMGVADVFEKRFTLDGSPRWKMAVRRFWVDDPEAVALGKYHTDGKVAVAVKRFADWTSVYSAQVGGLDAELLANIAGTAGAYALTRPGLVVDMNGHFLSLHAFAGGAYRLRLPRRARVFDVASGKVVAEDAEQVEISLPAQSSRWLLLQ
ncbi:MAG: beta-galactosidase, partial [Lentisphaeria bacterium]|nr:beta-galactosidase [Lentisphaeria bacterium]